MKDQMKAIEVTGTIDERGQFQLDEPLDVVGPARVRVILLLAEDTESSHEASNSSISTVHEACDLFVQKVRSIQVISEVLLVEDDEDGPTIWTVISAPPFDRDVRGPIYKAQLHVLRSLKEPLLDFYILNTQELPSGRASDVLPSGAKRLWKR